MLKRIWWIASLGSRIALAMVFVGALLTGCHAAKTGSEDSGKVKIYDVTDDATQATASPSPDGSQSGENGQDGEGFYTYEDRTAVNGKIRSYLTGRLVDAGIGNRRPVAVMMSNDKAALPQFGINRADIVYEAPAEGGINRYMGILENYDDLDRIGSVRSCRTYYIYFAREFDAVLAHYGQSTFAKPYLEYVDDVNGLEGKGVSAFYRTKDRKSPHNAYTSGIRLNEAIAEMGYSTGYDSDYRGHYHFAKKDRQVTLSGAPGVMDANQVVPGYVINKPWFEYHEDDGLYYRYQFGGPHMGNEGQIAVKNLIFQYCPVAHYATTDYLDINVHDDSYGLYATEGKAIPLKWKKDGEFGPTHYYDMEDHEIILNQGKTWVCVISAQDSSKVKVYGKQ